MEGFGVEGIGCRDVGLEECRDLEWRDAGMEE